LEKSLVEDPDLQLFHKKRASIEKERERGRERKRERTRARRRVTACIPRVASIRAIARKGMTPKGHCSLAWPALLCSAPLRSALRTAFRVQLRIHARSPPARSSSCALTRLRRA